MNSLIRSEGKIVSIKISLLICTIRKDFFIFRILKSYKVNSGELANFKDYLFSEF